MKGLKYVTLTLIGLSFVLGACSKSSAEAEVYGKVYWVEGWIVPIDSNTTDTIYYLHPAGNASVYLEQDPGSDIPYKGGDLFTTTDTSGYYKFKVVLGYDVDENTGLLKQNVIGDVKITAIWTTNGYLKLHNGDSVFVGGQFANSVDGLTLIVNSSLPAPDILVGYVYVMPVGGKGRFKRYRAVRAENPVGSIFKGK